MKKDNRKIIIIYFIISYIFIIKPLNEVIKLKQEKKIKLKKMNELIEDNKIFKKKLILYSKQENYLKQKITNHKIKFFKNLGEYNSYISFYMKKNNLKTLYIGRSILKKNSVVVSYNLKGKLYNFIGFLNEIEKEKKVYLSGESFYIEKKGDDITATINLEGNIFKELRGEK